MNTLLQDIRFSARQLAKHPGSTAIVLVTLALGIGATTTCFSLLSAFALAPLPFHDPGELIAVVAVQQPTGARTAVPVESFPDLAQGSGLLAGAVAYSSRPITVSGAAAAAERVAAAEVSGDLFALLGVSLQRGAWIPASGAGSTAAVISDALWKRRFASDPAAVGASITLDGELHTIAGIAAPRFSFPRGADVWIQPARRRTQPVEIVARLAPGVSSGQADAGLRTVAVPSTPGRASTLAAVPLRETMVAAKHRNATFGLLVASALVLAVACANLAGLLLARVGARKHEIAVRSAIGASRGRLVRQLMTESLMLSLAGGALGTLVAAWGVDLFVSTLGVPREAEWIRFAVDLRVLTFALAASAGTALLVGVAPALKGTRVDLREVLQEEGRTAAAGPRTGRVRRGLVAAQMALSLTLVAGAAAVVMSSISLDRIEPGFNRDRLLAVRATLAGARFDAPAERMAFVDGAVERLRALPGVAAVTAVSHVPVGDRDVPFWPFVVDGAGDASAGQQASIRFADAGYLDTMGIPVSLGRGFTLAEARDAGARVILINSGMATRHWPGRNPVGSRVRLPGPVSPDSWYTIVGVVGDVAQRQLPGAPENQIYLPLAHARDVTLVVRAVSDPGALAAAARAAVRGADDTVATSTRTMADMYQWYTNDRRGQGVVLAALGLVALLVAALGVFGVMALMVTERQREIAIRKALGGSDAAVWRLVLGRGLRLAFLGIGAGLVPGAALTAFLSSIFYGVHPFDVRVLGGTAALLGTMAIAASWWPARRAMALDPMTVLKQ